MKNLLNQNREANRERFARKLRVILDEGAQALPQERLEQLALARKAALRAHKLEKPATQWLLRPTPVAAGTLTLEGPGQARRFGLSAALIAVVVAGLIGIFHTESERHIDELAEMDAALFTDDIPISAYADHGFNAFIKQNR